MERDYRTPEYGKHPRRKRRSKVLPVFLILAGITGALVSMSLAFGVLQEQTKAPATSTHNISLIPGSELTFNSGEAMSKAHKKLQDSQDAAAFVSTSASAKDISSESDSVPKETESGSSVETPDESGPSDDTIADLEELAARDADLPSPDKYSNYYYMQLDDDLQLVYRQMYDCFTSMTEDRQVCTLDPDSLQTVFNAVMNDHPELFHVSGYHYTTHSVDDEIRSITITGTYK
jgi:hypothetical protein